MPRLSKETRSLYKSDEWQETAMTNYSTKNEIKNRLEKYFYQDTSSAQSEWTRMPEVPTEAEIGGIEDGKLIADKPNIPYSKIDEAYTSKNEYLETQYTLMRLDGTLPLAQAVEDFRGGDMRPDSNDYRLYEEVTFTGLAIARDGLALRTEFSATSIGKVVRWAKSKRLRSGGLVALTPVMDGFQTKCVPAVIASRLLENLEVDPPRKPSIYVYIGDSKQLEVDPQQKWIMMECTQGYWEAYRHTLKTLQRVRIESFPLQEYLIGCKSHVDPPAYRLQFPVMDIRDASHSHSDKLKALDVLQEWPEFQEVGAPQKDPSKITSDLDTSQIKALKRMLTKKVAIVQGPPGTGKTFTSVAAIKMILHNLPRSEPPIIIAAQTNHAIDQILRYIAKFEPEFIRLGGQTTDHDIIKPRTLYNIKNKKKQPPSIGTRSAANARKAVGTELEKLLLPLLADEPISADTFCKHGLLSEKQKDSVNKLESKWAAENATSKMNLWCDNRLRKIVNEDVGNPYASRFGEEFENLDETELEAPDNDDDKFEHLTGRKFGFSSGYTMSGRPSGIYDDEIVELLAKHDDLVNIAEKYRPEIYDFLRRELTKKITERVRQMGQKCQEAATMAKIGRWESDYEFISSARVIGLTTTGLSKYRGLLSVLNPKIVLIEEAAETLEPYTVAAAFDTLEHLILVGDHQQLRANCSFTELIGEPVNFDISLFERLVKNQVEYTTLNTQRRMRPEIRNLIQHIYPNLEDHSSVLDRPHIPGLGGYDVWFYHHDNAESMDETRSKKNEHEARMIVEFTKYLLWNNIPLHRITILTFYNGQKRLLLDRFHKSPVLGAYRVNVCTVDSYQGEENDVILLSLVRSNKENNIGFLHSINRACVALSRARLGFYIFGNARLLLTSDHWTRVIDIIRAQESMRSYLPLYCPIHDKETDARGIADLEPLNGGCEVECGQKLECGHLCPLKCHPGRPCDREDCTAPCEEAAPCGHPCTAPCAETCECRDCTEKQRREAMYISFDTANENAPPPPHLQQLTQGSSPVIGPDDAWPALENSTQPLKQDPTPVEVANKMLKWTQFARDESSRSRPTSRSRNASLVAQSPETLQMSLAVPQVSMVSGNLTDRVDRMSISHQVDTKERGKARKTYETRITYGDSSSPPQPDGSLI